MKSYQKKEYYAKRDLVYDLAFDEWLKYNKLGRAGTFCEANPH